MNEGDLEATVHWHGLRLENRYDGTHETQAPMPVGEQLHLPRARSPTRALYWYHPHIREDYGQEMGLYGNILVVPPIPTTGRRRTASSLLTLDDILIEDGQGRAVQPVRDDVRGDGPLRQRAARRRRAGPRR